MVSASLLTGMISIFVFSVMFYRYRRAVAMVSDFPGLRLIVSPMCTLGLVLPRLPMPLYTYPGFSFPWNLKHAGLFKLFGCDTVSLCGWDGRAILYTCDVPFLTRMASYSGSTVFPKPIEEYGVLSYFGDNVVIAEHANWRRQRKVSAPAFSSKMFERLWIDMASIVREMLHEERWEERTRDFVGPLPMVPQQAEYVAATGEIYFPHVVDLTLRMALAAIARTGFGIEFEWRSDESFTKSCSSFGQPFWKSILATFLRIVYQLANSVIPTIVLDDVVRAVTTFAATNQHRRGDSPLHLALQTTCKAIITLFEITTVPHQHTMRLQEALHLVAKESTLKLAISSLPSWLKCLPFRRVSRMNMAFDCLHRELKNMIASRRQEIAMFMEGSLESMSMSSMCDSDESGSSGLPSASTFGSQLQEKEEPFDLLSNLVRSAIQTERVGGQSLSEDEIIGNAYIYLLAGHETTAHSMAWTLALLAAYPEEQEKAYHEIMEHDSQEDTIIRDYPKFKFLLACYYETLRLFPPVQQIPKVAAEDTQILIDKSNKVGPDSPVPAQQSEQRLMPPSESLSDRKLGTFPSLDSEASLTPSPSRVFGNHRRHKLPPLIIPARNQTHHQLDFSSSLPSLPSTPVASPMRETMAYVGTPVSGNTPSSLRSEFIGPAPFVQLSKDGSKVKRSELSSNEEQVSLIIKKGTIIFISPPAVHYNPKYWEEPEKFTPERFLKPYCRSAFIPFGVGTRACLGRKFSEVESVCMLVHLLRSYSVHLPLLPGQTVEEARAKFSRASVRITLTPDKVPLVFRRRK